jgi:hypothetical protein
MVSKWTNHRGIAETPRGKKNNRGIVENARKY